MFWPSTTNDSTNKSTTASSVLRRGSGWLAHSFFASKCLTGISDGHSQPASHQLLPSLLSTQNVAIAGDMLTKKTAWHIIYVDTNDWLVSGTEEMWQGKANLIIILDYLGINCQNIFCSTLLKGHQPYTYITLWWFLGNANSLQLYSDQMFYSIIIIYKSRLCSTGWPYVKWK